MARQLTGAAAVELLAGSPGDWRRLGRSAREDLDAGFALEGCDQAVLGEGGWISFRSGRDPLSWEACASPMLPSGEQGVIAAGFFGDRPTLDPARREGLRSVLTACLEALAPLGAAAAPEPDAQTLRADRMASLGTLTAGIAHEINNPLAYVLSNLSFVGEMLAVLEHEPMGNAQRTELFGELRDAISEAQQGSARVRDIVRDLKTFTRPSDDGVGPVDVVEALEAALKIAHKDLGHRATVLRELRPLPAVDANAARLSQVFLNLLVNAAHALPDRDRAENRVRVAAWTDRAGAAVVEIRDNGCGMTEEVRQRIFDPFFTTKPVGVGTGLGLPICLATVTGYGGKLEVESEPGRGTAIRITLPRSSLAASDPAKGTPRRRGLSVLVVDDDPLMGRSLRRMLEPDHRVTVVTSGRAAVELIRSGARFQLILCDLMMPELTGMAVCQAIEALAPEQAARMLFMTGGAVTESARRFVESGHPALEKPFSRAELEEALPTLLRDASAAA